MHDDPIRHHIQAAAARPERETRRLTSRIFSSCWPGGAEDRREPGALDWVRRWRPATIETKFPACSCELGHCVVCN